MLYPGLIFWFILFFYHHERYIGALLASLSTNVRRSTQFASCVPRDAVDTYRCRAPAELGSDGTSRIISCCRDLRAMCGHPLPASVALAVRPLLVRSTFESLARVFSSPLVPASGNFGDDAAPAADVISVSPRQAISETTHSDSQSVR